MAASGIAHIRWRREGARSPLGRLGTMSDCVSITEVTTAAGWIAGLAIVALIAAGWRKTARATADPARARDPGAAPWGVEVMAGPTQFERPTRWYRRVWSVVAGSVLGVWLGAVVATILGFGVAFAVITLTHMLKR